MMVNQAMVYYGVRLPCVTILATNNKANKCADVLH